MGLLKWFFNPSERVEVIRWRTPPPLPHRAPFPEEVFPEPRSKFDFWVEGSCEKKGLDIAFSLEGLDACVLLADGAPLTLYVNSPLTPDHTIPLPNGEFLFWCKLFPGWLFTNDVKTIFVSNHYIAPARFRMALHYTPQRASSQASTCEISLPESTRL